MFAGCGGAASDDRARQYTVARRLASRGPHERFIYLAADKSNRVVKVGSSLRPAQRVQNLWIAASYFFSTAKRYEPMHFRLVAQWPLGVLSFKDALGIESRLHVHLRSVAEHHEGEWYRLATSRAHQEIVTWMARIAS